MTAPSSLNLDQVADASIVLPQATAAAANPAAQPAPAPAPAAPKAATLAELKAACPGATNDFLVQQLEAGATVAVATGAFLAQLQKENLELKAKGAQPAAEQTEKPSKKPGASPVPAAAGGGKEGASASGGDAVARFNDLVAELVAKGQTRTQACVNVAKANPELHVAFLLATNSKQKAQRLIREKFE